MVQAYPGDELWRVWLTVGIVVSLLAASLGIWKIGGMAEPRAVGRALMGTGSVFVLGGILAPLSRNPQIAWIALGAATVAAGYALRAFTGDRAKEAIIPVMGIAGTNSPAALAAYAVCPSPGQAGTIASFDDVGLCLADIVARAGGSGTIETLWNHILRPDYDDAALNGKPARSCAEAIAKGAAKLHNTATKTLAKLQKAVDKNDGPYQSGFDRHDEDRKSGG